MERGLTVNSSAGLGEMIHQGWLLTWLLSVLLAFPPRIKKGQILCPRELWGAPKSGHPGAWQLHTQVPQRSLTKGHQKPISFYQF